VTTNGADVAEQPPASVAVTEYEPAVETTMDCVVSPVDQRFPVDEEDVSVIGLTGETDEGPLMVGVAGAAFAVTRYGADAAEQPFASVAVTV
jgi:hypothetical protein